MNQADEYYEADYDQPGEELYGHEKSNAVCVVLGAAPALTHTVQVRP